MPIPFILGGIAVAAGLVGAKKAKDASDKNARAKRINRRADEKFENAKKALLAARDEAGRALENLGQAKVDILHGSVTRFVDTFGKIHHVELTGSAGMDELAEFTVNEDALKEMGELGSLASKMVSGTVEGLAAGGLMAFGAYSAAGLLGTAGTGAAIAGLSGAAATNATLALLGGGTLAAGGLGIAGGTAVLGGLVAGPAIAVMGFMMDAKADKNLDIAKSKRAKAEKAEAEMKLAGDACRAIGKRANMFRHLISEIDPIFKSLIGKMEAVVKEEGTDYRDYGEEEKKTIAMALATAGAVKAVLDTPILTKEGAVTEESLRAYKKVEAFLPKVEG